MSQRKPDAVHTLFNNFFFQIGWIGFLVIVLKFVAWPVRDRLLVTWVYGKQAYVGGIRVISAKPTIFSNGEGAPTFPDLVTGFGAFFVTFFGLTFLLIFILKLIAKTGTRK